MSQENKKRNLKIYKLREEGKTFQEIANKVGISKQRAYNLYQIFRANLILEREKNVTNNS